VSVRVKALLLLVASVVGLVGAVWLLLGRVITTRFVRLEEDTVRRNVERLLQAIDREAIGLEVTAKDWAEWDDAFAYLTTGSEEFERSNLGADSLQVLDLCSLAYLDTAGSLRFGVHLSSTRSGTVPLSPSHLEAIDQAIAAAGAGGSRRGVLLVDGSAHLLALRPVRHSDGTGRSPGFVAMMRALEPGIMARLTSALDLRAELVHEGLSGGAGDPGRGKAWIESVEAETITGVARVPVLLDGAGLGVRVREDRALTREGVAMARYLTLALAGCLLVFGTGLLVLLDRTVLGRLAAVEATARLIAANADPRARVAVHGRDEIARLAASINTMLAALERSEAEARAGEERYRAVVEDQAELVCRWRTNGEMVFVNRAFAELGDEPSQAWICRSFLDLVVQDDGTVASGIAARTPAHPMYTFVTRLARPSGEVRWIQWTNRTIFDAEDVAIEHQAVGRDITAARQGEETLRACEKTVRGALEGPPETGVLTDLGGSILSFNDATPGRLDVTVTELAGSQIADHLGSAATTWWQGAQRAIAEGRLQVLDAVRDGRILQVAIQPVRDAGGAVRQLAVFTCDLTDRRRAEEAERQLRERAQVEEALKGTRDVLAQISRSIREVLWIRERPDGRFSYASPGYEHIWGRSCDSLYADPGTFLAGIHPDDLEAVAASLRMDVPPAKRVVDFRVVRSDQTLRWVTVREFPLGEGDGAGERLLGLAEDITERKEMEQQSRRLEAELRMLARRIDEAREEERRKLAVWLHDEVGQLLTALRLDLAWLAHRLPRRHTELHARLQEVQALLEDRLTSVQRISIELRPSILEDLGLRAALEWAREQCTVRTGLQVELTMAVDEAEIPRPVALALLRITQEALTNIARHAHASHVGIVVRREGDRVELEVADNGRGIRPEEATGFQALGILGMRERTMAHGGTLEVRARPGGGSELLATMQLRRVGET
jgi:PAS domain S-box-containing protein